MFVHVSGTILFLITAALAFAEAPCVLNNPPSSASGPLSSVRTVALAGLADGGCSPLGEQKVAVLLLTFPGQPLTLSKSQIDAVFFGSGRSLGEYWRESSYGKTTVTGQVFGPFAISSALGCSQAEQILQAAVNAADSTVDLRAYNRLFLIFPKAPDCTVFFASLGCRAYTSASKGQLSASVAWLWTDQYANADTLLIGAAHEGGHNLGLAHASSLDFGSIALGPPGQAGTIGETGDNFSAMGSGWAYQLVNGVAKNVVGHYGAPHKFALGWLKTGQSLIEVETDGSFFLQPYEQPTLLPQVLRIRRRHNVDGWLWIEYRQNLGLFDPDIGYNGPSAFSGALIHYEEQNNPAYDGRTLLLTFNPSRSPNDFSFAPLAIGKSWDDVYSDLSIDVIGKSVSGLEIRVRRRPGAAFPAPLVLKGGITPIYSSSTAIQPSEWVSIYGANLATAPTSWVGDFPTSLGGTSVKINGKAAYLWYVSPEQINLQAPDDTATGLVSVEVTTATGSVASTVTLAQFSPSFSLLDTKHVAGIILRSDGSGAYGGGAYDIIGPTGKSFGYSTVAAKAGDQIELFGVGFGPTSPAVSAGQSFSGSAPTTNLVSLLINKVGVVPSFVGLSGAGLYQVNLTLPAGLGTGDVPVIASLGGLTTSSSVVISLQ